MRGVLDLQEKDPDDMARPRRLRTSGASDDLDTGVYAFDGAGNVTKMGPNVYLYDPLSRVTAAEVPMATDPCTDDRHLQFLTFSSESTIEACGEIVAGPKVEVTLTGDLTLRSGERVVLADGFSVASGGRFAAAVDPAIGGPDGEAAEATWAGEYDLFGNLTKITTQKPGGAEISRTMGVNAATNRLSVAAYDSAGNMTAWEGRGFRYGPFDMLRETGTHIFIYGPADERIWTVDWTAGTSDLDWVESYTLRDLDGAPLRRFKLEGGNRKADNWTLQADFVWRNGALLAAVLPDGTRHFHLDHLGSPRIVTDSARATRAHHSYFPFGEEATNPDDALVPLQYTGHERDDLDATGTTWDLDYMHARYFSSHLGRFQSVDPLGVAPEWPQSWNRYTYVLGNPMKYTDPRGLYWNLFQQVPNPFLFFGQTTSASTNVPLAFSVLGLLSGPSSSSSFGFALFGATPNPQAPPQSVNPQCSTVPQAPPGVNIDRNLSLVAATRNILGIGHSTALVVGASAPGSIWDFKAHHGSQYENFGNFHFGAASAVAGIPEGVALRGAGLVQISFSRTQYDWIYSQGLTPFPGQNPPFGDDPRDQQQIRLGYLWYENCP